jgi:hypothetical protein
MNRSLYQLPEKHNPIQLAVNLWKIFWIVAPVASAALILILTGHDRTALHHSFFRTPSSPVKQTPVLDEHRVDALDLSHAVRRSTNPRADACYGSITRPVLPEVPSRRTDSATTILSGVAPSTDDSAQLIQTNPRRFKKCVSAF